MTTPRKVVFFHAARGRRLSGAPRLIRTLLHGLDRDLFEPTLVVTRESELSESLRAEGIPVRVVRLPESLDVYGRGLTRLSPVRAARSGAELVRTNRRVARELAELGPDLIWANNVRSFACVFLAATTRRIPIVWNLWLGEPSRGLTGPLNSLALRFSRRIVTEYRAQATKLFTPRQLRTARGKIQTVSTGQPSDSFLEGRSPLGGEPPVVGALGEFSPRKGQDVFLRMARRVADERPDVRFRIGGEEASVEFRPYSEGLVDLARELELEDTVSWTGWIDRPADFHASVDVYVQTSRREGLPGAVREAMLAGRPVVATDVGGTAELVEHGVTGWVVPPDDPPAAAQALLRLLENPVEARRMGEAGRARVERYFSEESFVSGTARVLLEALGTDVKERGTRARVPDVRGGV